MARTTAFAIPEGTRAAWHQRLKDAGVTTSETTRFAETRLQVTAPDGLPLALIETAPVETPTADAPSGGSGSDVPDRLAIRGFHSTTLPAPEAASLHALLTDVFGWTKVATDDAYTRFAAPSGGIGTVVDVHERPSHASGRMGKGTVHHVAFRARTPDEQAHWQQLLRTRGINVTDVKDRRYFQSIYFRDATWTAGILFEIATDAPGFLADDETPDTLGTTLQLPPELEERRAELEDRLPPLARPQTA
jgi:glyoxalase family protein